MSSAVTVSQNIFSSSPENAVAGLMPFSSQNLTNFLVEIDDEFYTKALGLNFLNAFKKNIYSVSFVFEA